MEVGLFLKPSLKKLAVFVILLILLIFINGIFDGCVGGKICGQGQTNFHPPFICRFSCIPASQAKMLNLVYRVPIFFLGIVFAWLIVCLIFYPKHSRISAIAIEKHKNNFSKP